MTETRSRRRRLPLVGLLIWLALGLIAGQVDEAPADAAAQPPPIDECLPQNMKAGQSFAQAYDNCFVKPNSYHPAYQACVRARAPQDVAAVQAAVRACLAAPLPTTTPGPTPTHIPTATPGPTATAQPTRTPPFPPPAQRLIGTYSVVRGPTPEDRRQCVLPAAWHLTGPIRFEVRWGRSPDGWPAPESIVGSFDGGDKGEVAMFCGPENGSFFGTPYPGFLAKRGWRFDATVRATFEGKIDAATSEFTLQGPFDGQASFEYTENRLAGQRAPLPASGQQNGSGPVTLKGKYWYTLRYDGQASQVETQSLTSDWPSGIDLPGRFQSFGSWRVGPVR